MWKWVVLIVLGALLVFAGYRISQRSATDARIAAEIRANPDGERAAKTMVVTLADGRVYPVNFLLEDGRVFMGIDGRWWREFVGAGQPISMHIKGQDYQGHAVAELDDQAYIDDIFSRLRPTVPE